VALCPPLIITEPEIDEMFARLDRALERAGAKLQESVAQ
jgi:adenosylmethionine-8-amino-7-oxononanoate aminotransferase